MNRMPPCSRLLVGFAASAALVSGAACHSGAGVNRFSEPSLSARESKRLGVFLQPVTATIQQNGSDGGHWQLEEAWLEERVERYEAVPIRKGAAGIWLCVRFTEKGTDPCGDTARLTAPGGAFLRSECRVMSKSSVVFAFQATTAQLLPPKGTITISDERAVSEGHPGQEIVSVDYELSGAADIPTAESDRK